jgi:hypothetical protein
MMRVDGFSRSLLFAVVAAAGVLPWMLLARPAFGSRTALALYLVGAVATYLGGLAPARGRRVATWLVALAAGLAVATLARSIGELAFGLGGVLAIGRSAFLYRAPAARAVVIEALVTGGGLVFARCFAGPSAAETVFALWAFFLVQSVYFLISGIRPRASSARRRDPFEEAYGRALTLLERGSR